MCRVRVSAKEPVKDLDSEGLLWVRSPVLCPDTFSGGRSTPTQQRLPSTLPPKQLAAAKQQGLALPRRLWAGLSAQVFHWRRTVLRLRLSSLIIYFTRICVKLSFLIITFHKPTACGIMSPEQPIPSQ